VERLFNLHSTNEKRFSVIQFDWQISGAGGFAYVLTALTFFATKLLLSRATHSVRSPFTTLATVGYVDQIQLRLRAL
jgi:hypothetical protein